jgi:hypothetical protein
VWRGGGAIYLEEADISFAAARSALRPRKSRRAQKKKQQRFYKEFKIYTAQGHVYHKG